MSAVPAVSVKGLQNEPVVTPLIARAWRAKLACTLAILGYYAAGYFVLNRIPFEEYHDVPAVPVIDDLPLIPWTILVYNSVFVLGALGIWMLPDARTVQRYFVSVVVAYTINYLFFALIPTRIHRAPLPEDDGFFLWAMARIRDIDKPYTCFPSLHMTNSGLVVIALWRTKLGPWFLLWTLAIAVSTLTTDQHLFLDLPAGILVALVGHAVGRRVVPEAASA
jgi:hypothetical protein